MNKACGVFRINFATGELLNDYDFRQLGFTGKCMINDVVVDSTSTAVYATDFASYRVFKIDIAQPTPVNPVSVIADSTAFLCDSAAGPCPCPDDLCYNGPNGIEYFRDGANEYVIVGVSAGKLVRLQVNLQTYPLIETTVYPKGALQGVDGKPRMINSSSLMLLSIICV